MQKDTKEKKLKIKKPEREKTDLVLKPFKEKKKYNERYIKPDKTRRQEVKRERYRQTQKNHKNIKIQKQDMQLVVHVKEKRERDFNQQRKIDKERNT